MKKMAVKHHRSEFFAIRTQIIKLCTDIAVRILLTLGGGALYKGGVNRINDKRYFISSDT